MGGIGYETTIGRKNSAGKIEALFDVNAYSGLLQDPSHLLRNALYIIFGDFSRLAPPNKGLP